MTGKVHAGGVPLEPNPRKGQRSTIGPDSTSWRRFGPRYLRETPEHLLWLEKEVGLPKPGKHHICLGEEFFEGVAG